MECTSCLPKWVDLEDSTVIGGNHLTACGGGECGVCGGVGMWWEDVEFIKGMHACMVKHLNKTYFTNCLCTCSISSLVLYSWEKREGRGGEKGGGGGEGRGGEKGGEKRREGGREGRGGGREGRGEEKGGGERREGGRGWGITTVHGPRG